MARALKLLRHIGLPLLLSAAAAPACALGPSAPFTPPAAAASAPTAAASTPAVDSAQTPATAEVSGLAGVRLGMAPQALIDGRWHRAGDAVRGARLIGVTRHGVTLQHSDGRVDQLFLLQSAIAPARARP